MILSFVPLASLFCGCIVVMLACLFDTIDEVLVAFLDFAV